MYTFACKDLGMKCDQVITGNSVAEVVAAANVHAKKVHIVELKAMPAAQVAGMDKVIESKIKRV